MGTPDAWTAHRQQPSRLCDEPAQDPACARDRYRHDPPEPGRGRLHVIGPAHVARRIAPCHRQQPGANECLAPPVPSSMTPTTGAKHTHPYRPVRTAEVCADQGQRQHRSSSPLRGSGRCVLTPPLGSTRPQLGRTPKTKHQQRLDSLSSVMNADRRRDISDRIGASSAHGSRGCSRVARR